MDQNECETVIPAARNISGLSTEELLNQLDNGAKQFSNNTRKQFSKDGE
jgi:hypothetical protein